MFRDAALIAGKDLRIEWRSRVTVNQVVPFALVVLVLFAFALDPDRGTLRVATPGLFWIAVLFTAVLAVQRSFNIEVADAGRDGLRLSGLDPAGIFLGKAGALALQLLALEATLGVGVAILYGTAWIRGRKRQECSRSRRCSCRPRSSPRSGWPPPARCTAPSPPDCEFVTRCCPCCSSPPSHRS